MMNLHCQQLLAFRSTAAGLWGTDSFCNGRVLQQTSYLRDIMGKLYAPRHQFICPKLAQSNFYFLHFKPAKFGLRNKESPMLK